MASQFKFKCLEETAGVGGEVIDIDAENSALQFQISVIVGSLTIAGSPGKLFGKDVSPITLNAGENMSFNANSYTNIQITIPEATQYRIVANS